MKLPTIFQIELTSVCNVRCTMCPYSMMTRPKMHMQWDTLLNIVQYLRPFQSVGLHVMGDPLLHPQLISMIKFIAQAGAQPEFATNGMALTEELADGLLTSGLHTIWFSIDSADKDRYEAIRVGAVFEQVVENVRYFLQQNDKAGQPVKAIIQKVGPVTDKADSDAFIKMWAPYDARVKFLDTWAGTFDYDVCVPDARQPCAEPWARVAILVNGDVVPCCRDWEPKCVYGNINDDTMYTIWHGVQAEVLRQDMLSGAYSVEPCASCREWWITMDREVVEP